MNAFLGVKVLTDLLIMGRVGIFVDAPALTGEVTLAQAQFARAAALRLLLSYRGHPELDVLEARGAH